MNIKYENNAGQILNLSDWPISIVDMTQLFGWSWEYEVTGKRITKFTPGKTSRKIDIAIFADDRAEYNSCMNRMTEIAETDVINLTPGKIWCGEYYMKCYITEVERSEYEDEFNTVETQMTVETTQPIWCREKTERYHASIDQILDETKKEQIDEILKDATTKKEYPYDYPYGYFTNYEQSKKRYMEEFPYDYHKKHTMGRINNDHFVQSEFRMTIYGPCTRPEIMIGEHVYQVSTTLHDGEYLVIDSKERTVIKYRVNGVIENAFNSRNKEYSVFAKIPPGKSYVKWNARYSFDITLMQERSEPKWNV